MPTNLLRIFKYQKVILASMIMKGILCNIHYTNQLDGLEQICGPL